MARELDHIRVMLAHYLHGPDAEKTLTRTVGGGPGEENRGTGGSPGEEDRGTGGGLGLGSGSLVIGPIVINSSTLRSLISKAAGNKSVGGAPGEEDRGTGGAPGEEDRGTGSGPS